MSWFSSLFQSSTSFYGDPFGPIIDTVSSFGYDLLPAYGLLPTYEGGGGGHAPETATAQGPVRTVIPVERPWEYVYPEPPPYVSPVLPGPVAVRPTEVLVETVTVEGVSTEVERYEEGDFPAGSIFAPGRTWGAEPTEQHGYDTEQEPVALSDVLDWGLDTLLGNQEWQTFGGPATPSGPMYIHGGGQLPAPSGVPGQPTTVYGYKGGTAVTSAGDCGNRRYVTLDRETGKISCKRRRRRRLLTNRDLADLASLKTITGGGAALNAAVIRAVR